MNISAFFSAIKNGNLEAIKIGLEHFDINEPIAEQELFIEIFWCTPLMVAVMSGNIPIVKFLLDHGADINGRSAGGMTCLIDAADRGNEAMVKVLMEYGANVNDRNNDGYTAMGRTPSSELSLKAMLLKHGGTL